jgi:hypothetical protein
MRSTRHKIWDIKLHTIANTLMDADMQKAFLRCAVVTITSCDVVVHACGLPYGLGGRFAGDRDIFC